MKNKKASEKNRNKKLIAFGDIHGFYKAAEAAIELSEKENATAVFLGDYIDRGPDSIKTIECLIEAKKKHPDWIFLRGNHEQMLLDLISGKHNPNTKYTVPSGSTSNNETTEVFNEWKSLSEQFKKEIVSFIEDTEFYYETDEWIFIHAPLKDSNIPIVKKSRDELIWNYDLNPIWQGKKFIHGHAVVDKLAMSNKGLNINTGCGFGGYLTGILVKIIFPEPNLKPTFRRLRFSISETGIILDDQP